MKYSFLFIILIMMYACGEKKSKNTSIKNTIKNEHIATTIIDSNLKISNSKNDSIIPRSISEIDSLIFRKFDYSQENLSTIEKAMADAGLVDVLDVLPQIKLDLRYTTNNNFVGEILYPDTKRCFLKIETLIKLSKALKILQKKNASYTFIIYDGARPQSVQYKMYEIAKLKGKTKYVAKPEKGGLHNFGVAVDIGLYDLATNQVVDMGTDFDFFGPEAQPRYHSQMLQEGKLTTTQIENRNILKTCMRQAGFIAILTEWWHFEAFDKYYTRAHFQIIK